MVLKISLKCSNKSASGWTCEVDVDRTYGADVYHKPFGMDTSNEHRAILAERKTTFSELYEMEDC